MPIHTDPVQLCERHFERIALCHWKDATGAMPLDTPIDHGIHDRHQDYFCDFGKGVVDWQAWTSLLERRNHLQDWAILELDASADPVTDIRNGRAYFEALFSPA